MIISLIDEAIAAGARQFKCCHTIGLSVRSLQRWRAQEGGDDKRLGPKQIPKNRLSDAERARVLDAVNRKSFRDLSVRQIVPHLADSGVYLASEATVYRILEAEGMTVPRGRARPRQNRAKPDEYIATAPNQVWSWDITYLPSPIRGEFYYLYVLLDVFSRAIVGAAVHDCQDDELAAELVEAACIVQGVKRDQLVLHADNGGPMIGYNLLRKLESLGVARSYSRPGVCDDNPYSEAAFRTLKYHRTYPRGPFTSLEEARAWVEGFVAWYNGEHLHSGVNYVRPIDRHEGRDEAILAKRRQVYAQARARHPERWGGRAARDWTPVREVSLNPDKDKAG